MKGRGEIITILCMSVFLICILYAMTYGGIVKAEELEKQPEEAGEKTEVDIEEELRWAEEVKKIQPGTCSIVNGGKASKLSPSFVRIFLAAM